MMMTKLPCAIFIQKCLWVLLVSSSIHALESDINCLRTLKSQLKDPKGHLFNWVFGQNNKKNICKFNGVRCWNDDDERVLSIDLSGFGLEGEFPSGVKECSSLAVLNLSRNNLSGPLLSDSFSPLRYLTALDLSYNSFSGKIPTTLSNIPYLNTLFLDHNRFTGHIPPGLAFNPRLGQFSVAHNHLECPIPEFTHANISLSQILMIIRVCVVSCWIRVQNLYFPWLLSQPLLLLLSFFLQVQSLAGYTVALARFRHRDRDQEVVKSNSLN